jgi:hypothetical protein
MISPEAVSRLVRGVESEYGGLVAYHRERGLDGEGAHRLAFAEAKDRLRGALAELERRERDAAAAALPTEPGQPDLEPRARIPARQLGLPCEERP